MEKQQLSRNDHPRSPRTPNSLLGRCCRSADRPLPRGDSRCGRRLREVFSNIELGGAGGCDPCDAKMETTLGFENFLRCENMEKQYFFKKKNKCKNPRTRKSFWIKQISHDFVFLPSAGVFGVLLLLLLILK